jgi:WD40 repeat protein
VRWGRLALIIVTVELAAVAGTVVSYAVNQLTPGTAGWLQGVGRHPLLSVALATGAVGVAGLLAWAAQRWYDRGLAELVPAVQRPEPWVVDRPAEVTKVVTALRRRGGGTVGVTTAVQAAGGFGKTTIAKIVRADPRVLRRFRGRVYWVTVGRDATGDALALLVSGLIARIDPGRALTDPDAVQAAEQLAAVLAGGPRRLLVLDDVWTAEQLAAFPVAGRAARLVTTRNPSLAGGVVPVRVDQMSSVQALALLQAGLPPLPPGIAAALVAETGRWPLLLRLASKALADQVKLDPDIAAAAEMLLGKLHQGGKLEMGTPTGAAGELDVADPAQRIRAVRATIEASTGLLPLTDRERLAELAVFAEDEAIPVSLVTTLWQATSGLDVIDARSLCARLADLALVALAPSTGGGTIAMHDVVRGYLRDELGATRIAQLHEMLLDSAAAGLPRAPTAGGAGDVTAWWELPQQERYLRDHLIEHLLAAGRRQQAEQASADLRWIDARLRASGPVGPLADLALIGTSRAGRLRRVLAQSAHLLGPTDPPHSLTDILYSRVRYDSSWGPQAEILAARPNLPALASAWPPPDLPSPALLHTLAGHTGKVTAVEIAPDGTWLATAGEDRTVRIWDAAAGEQRAVLTGYTNDVNAVEIAPDGTWLATAGEDRTVRIWDAATGEQRAVLTGHTRKVRAVAIAPDGTWLATAGEDRTVRIWDAATGEQRAVLTGHVLGVRAVAIAPDGTWLATANWDTAQVWDAATGEQRAVLTGHTRSLTAVAIAPDGTWLATGNWDHTVRIWDAATGRQRAVLTGHDGGVTAVAIAPDGAWLATAGRDRTARVWDAATGRQRAVLSGHTNDVNAVAIAPDGTWLATADEDQTVRVWDAATGEQRAVLTGHTRKVRAVAIAPDGTWLATAGEDRTVRVWDPATGQQRADMAGHVDRTKVVFAPDGTWLATTSIGTSTHIGTITLDGSVRVWDSATGRQRAVLTGHDLEVTTVAIASDSSRLVTVTFDGSVRVWDATTGRQREDLSGLGRMVAITPDGTWLAATSDGMVRIWDTATGCQRAVLRGLNGGVAAVAFAPNGAWLATVTFDGSVRVWDAATGEQRAVLTDHTTKWTNVTIAPDSSWLATAAHRRSVLIWDPATGEQRAVLTGHTRKVRTVAIAPDSTWLATAAEDRTVRIWDAATGEQRAVLTDHTTRWMEVTIAPDSSWLATTITGRRPVRIWDAATGQQRAILAGPDNLANAMTIAPDSTWLATTGTGGTIRVWDPATGAIGAVMRVDSELEGCAWSPSGRMIAAAGSAGLFLFSFNS